MSVTNNYYFTPEPEEDGSSSETPSFYAFLFRVVKIGLFLLGVWYVISLTPLYTYLKDSVNNITIQQPLIIRDDIQPKKSSRREKLSLGEQNRLINQERDIFHERKAKR